MPTTARVLSHSAGPHSRHCGLRKPNHNHHNREPLTEWMKKSRRLRDLRHISASWASPRSSGPHDRAHALPQALQARGLCLRGGARHCAHEELHDRPSTLSHSNAPYVGLLGTVIGIMLTFYSIWQHGRDRRGCSRTPGLSFALKPPRASRSGRRDSDAHLLQRPAACQCGCRLEGEGLMEEAHDRSKSRRSSPRYSFPFIDIAPLVLLWRTALSVSIFTRKGRDSDCAARMRSAQSSP